MKNTIIINGYNGYNLFWKITIACNINVLPGKTKRYSEILKGSPLRLRNIILTIESWANVVESQHFKPDRKLCLTRTCPYVIITSTLYKTLQQLLHFHFNCFTVVLFVIEFGALLILSFHFVKNGMWLALILTCVSVRT